MFGTYQRLNVCVSASNTTVIRAARKKIATRHRKSLCKREERKAFYRIMLAYHQEAREIYRIAS